MVSVRTQKLVARRDALLQSGKRLSRSELQEVNKAQTSLRNERGVKYSDAPDYRRQGGEIIARRGIGGFETEASNPETFRETGERIVERDGYKYRRTSDGGFETVSRPEEKQKELDETVAINVRINKGEKVQTKELAYGRSSIDLTASRVQSQSEVSELNRRRDVINEQSKRQREKAPNIYGYEAIGQQEDKSYIYSRINSPDTFVLRQRDVGTNIRSGNLIPINQKLQQSFDVIRNKKDRDFALRFTAYATKTQVDKYVVNPALSYARDVQSQTYQVPKIIDLGEKGVVSVKQYKTISNRPDIRLYASLRSTLSGYSPVQERVFQQDKLMRRIVGGALVSADLVYSGGDVLTRNIPYVGTFYRATVNTAKPFITGAIRDPVLTYASVRAPAFFGKRFYGFLDKADVLQSVGVEGVKGYFQGGIGGAISGATGGYVGERVSDKSAFFAQGTPENPIYRLSIQGRNNVFVLKPEGGLNQFTVLQQYVPKYTYGQEFVNLRDVGTVKQRFKITRRPEEVNDAGLYYPTTLAPEPVKFVYNRRLMSGGIVSQRSISEVRKDILNQGRVRGFGKRGQSSASFFGGSTSNFQGTQNGNYQDTLQSPIGQINAIIPINTQSQEQSFAREYQKANQKTIKMLQLNANARTRAITGLESQFTARSRSRSQSFVPSITQFLGLSQTRTQSQTISQYLSPSLTRTQTITQYISPTLTQTQTLTRTLTRTPTITKTPTLTPYFKRNKQYRNLYKQPKQSKRMLRYTQSIGAIFDTAPLNFNRKGISAYSGIGVRF